MKHLALTLALRLSWRQARPLTRLTTGLALLTTALGVAVMLIATSATHGFEDEIQRRITSLAGDIEVQAIGSDTATWVLSATDADVARLARAEPAIALVAPVLMREAILRGPAGMEGVQLKGVGPRWNGPFFARHLHGGTLPDFGGPQPSRDLLLATRLAARLNVAAGDSARLYFWERGKVRVRPVRVVGIFDTGLYDFDGQLALCDRRLIERIQGTDTGYAQAIELHLRPGTDSRALAEDLDRQLPHDKQARSAAERFPELYNWLELQHQNVFFILVLMTLVAVLNMSTALIITITERTAFVGLLRALGATSGMVLRVFAWRAALLVGVGVVVGNGLAFLLIYLQQETGWVQLNPESYFVREAPVRWVWGSFGRINAGVLVVATVSLLLPALIVRGIRPVVALRHD